MMRLHGVGEVTTISTSGNHIGCRSSGGQATFPRLLTAVFVFQTNLNSIQGSLSGRK
jgi:hypothetical protein